MRLIAVIVAAGCLVGCATTTGTSADARAAAKGDAPATPADGNATPARPGVAAPLALARSGEDATLHGRFHPDRSRILELIVHAPSRTVVALAASGVVSEYDVDTLAFRADRWTGAPVVGLHETLQGLVLATARGDVLRYVPGKPPEPSPMVTLSAPPSLVALIDDRLVVVTTLQPPVRGDATAKDAEKPRRQGGSRIEIFERLGRGDGWTKASTSKVAFADAMVAAVDGTLWFGFISGFPYHTRLHLATWDLESRSLRRRQTAEHTSALVALSDGRVLAYGGFSRPSVVDVTERCPENRWTIPSCRARYLFELHEHSPPAIPTDGFHDLVEEAGHRFVAVTGRDIYQVGSDFRRWRLLSGVDLDETRHFRRSGPMFTEVAVIPSEANRLILGTYDDGPVEFDGRQGLITKSSVVPGALSHVRGAHHTPIGLVADTKSGYLERSKQGWRPVDLGPNIDLDDCRVATTSGTSTFFRCGSPNAGFRFVEWLATGLEVRDVEGLPRLPDGAIRPVPIATIPPRGDVFVDAGARWWWTDEETRTLKKLDGRGNWQIRGSLRQFPRLEPVVRVSQSTHTMFEEATGSLWELVDQPRGATLRPLALPTAVPKATCVVVWRSRVRLGTLAGVFTVDGARVERLDDSREPVHAMAVDGAGRLWTAGPDGVRVRDAAGTRFVPIALTGAWAIRDAASLGRGNAGIALAVAGGLLELTLPVPPGSH